MKEPQLAPKTAYGFPIRSAKELGLEDYFRKNKNVSGMAWGGGLNGSGQDEERSVVINPFAPAMMSSLNREALLKVEAARHLMRDNPIPAFPISPEQQAWREKSFTSDMPYRTDDNAFRETLISRHLVGDEGPSSPESQKIADEFYNKFFKNYDSEPKQLTAMDTFIDPVKNNPLAQFLFK